MSRGRVVVVGSGASGVQFARTALERDFEVLMLDVGHGRPEQPMPEADLDGLKRGLDDPSRWFLGDDFGSLILPGDGDEYYGFPPSKAYVFRDVGGIPTRATGFAPLLSYAAGGLAEVWTGGCYPFNDGELGAWPFGLDALLPWYGEVGRRIGISGAEDDLAAYLPMHDGLMPPRDLDEHARVLFDSYAKRRDRLWRRHRVRLGHSRLAVLADDHNGRQQCDDLGRCLWGCPRQSLWTPSVELARLRSHPEFTYRSGVTVRRLAVDDGGRARAVEVERLDGAGTDQVPVDRVALAAGALASSGILLRTFRDAGGTTPVLSGLMDNRQVMMPFVNLKMLARPFESRSYQYHQLAFGIEGEAPLDYVHGLVTTLKTALVHPLVQSLPFGMRASLRSFRDMHAALGLVNLNLADTRRSTNTVALEEDSLVVRYEPDAAEPRRLARVIRTMRRVLKSLGCLAPEGMTHVRPMGASVHYAGMVPMTESEEPGVHTATPEGASRDFENVLLVDGITFPSLPAKNLTFTLMANASRIADLHLG